MEIKWEYVLAVAIIVVVGIALIVGQIGSNEFIVILTILLNFIAEYFVIRVFRTELREQRAFRKGES